MFVQTRTVPCAALSLLTLPGSWHTALGLPSPQISIDDEQQAGVTLFLELSVSFGQHTKSRMALMTASGALTCGKCPVASISASTLPVMC